MHILRFLLFLFIPLFGVEPPTPVEDLMMEHGVLERLLLIYENLIPRIAKQEPSAAERTVRSAKIVQAFIENYHAVLEEDYIFPRFEQAGKLVKLCQTLRDQHALGRTITNYLIDHAKEPEDPDIRATLVRAMQQYVAMYRPHEAREDTILFPAFRYLASPEEQQQLQKLFAAKQKALFGSFHQVVDQVAQIEKDLGIYQLSHFDANVDIL